jgi:hypothetical protein
LQQHEQRQDDRDQGDKHAVGEQRPAPDAEINAPPVAALAGDRDMAAPGQQQALKQKESDRDAEQRHRKGRGDLHP